MVLRSLLGLALVICARASVEEVCNPSQGTTCEVADAWGDHSLLQTATRATTTSDSPSGAPTAISLASTAASRRRKSSKKKKDKTSGPSIKEVDAKVKEVTTDVKSIKSRLDGMEEQFEEVETKLDDLARNGGDDNDEGDNNADATNDDENDKDEDNDENADKSNDDDDADDVAPGKTPETIIERWLNVHNFWRCIHDSPPVVWDEDIAKGAQKWADRGQMSHDKCYDLPNPYGPVGENLASGTRMTPEQAANMWHDENPEKGPQCGGHCTAMLWKSGTKMGCGIGESGMGPLMVCRYGGGNPLSKRLAPNFGGRDAYAQNVGFPDDSKKASCKKKYPVKEEAQGGGGGGSGPGGGGSGPGSGGSGGGRRKKPRGRGRWPGSGGDDDDGSGGSGRGGSGGWR